MEKRALHCVEIFNFLMLFCSVFRTEGTGLFLFPVGQSVVGLKLKFCLPIFVKVCFRFAKFLLLKIDINSET
jgi:hypothetical protein